MNSYRLAVHTISLGGLSDHSVDFYSPLTPSYARTIEKLLLLAHVLVLLSRYLQILAMNIIEHLSLIKTRREQCTE